MKVFSPEPERVPAGWSLIGVWSVDGERFPVWSSLGDPGFVTLCPVGSPPWKREANGAEFRFPVSLVVGDRFFIAVSALPEVPLEQFGPVDDAS